jgi:HlyD family secretion protein
MSAKRIVPIVMVIALVGSWLFVRSGRRSATPGELLASGTVEATEADVGAQLAGRIAEVLVHEGESVRRGQLLARLDDAELRARLAVAEAQAALARAQLAEAERGPRAEEIAQARAAAAAAASRLEDAQRDVERARMLFDGGAISREALDKAVTLESVARAQRDQANEALRALEEGTRPERVAAARAALRQAEATIDQMEATIANAAATAPFDGVVSVRHREPGEVVAAGLPIVSVMDPENRWVRIYVPEPAVGRISIGQQAAIFSDGHPDRPFDGEVVFIASEAEFTPRNVQTAEERTKLVYAVKVRITGDRERQLKPGLPVDVRLLASPERESSP